ncbi:MAG TPA: RNA polymerase sigma factor, partial [Dehalococcoidia bacterium]|nr:RNA polymerase sigma factor [Dehalococcoidia bacterium]
MTDGQLIRLARENDESAYRHILERYVPLVTGYFAGKTDRSATEDLVQEVFMRAFDNIHTISSSGKLGPWLLGIARNRLKDYYQSRKRSRVVEQAFHRERGTIGRQIQDIADSTSNPAERAHGSQLEEMVILSLGELKVAYRVILYLRLVDELSYVEIAERLSLKDSTVRVRARRGLHQLREKLTLQGITPEL